MEKQIKIWDFIGFDEQKWSHLDTSTLDELSPSWFKKREHLQENSEAYKNFLDELKRQHAIETGIIEKLYDLKDGVTQTFIKEGFAEMYLQHGDTNIAPKQLMFYLQDHFKAIDFVFDVVKQDRPMNKGFILELHQLITRHQDTTDAIDSFGKVVQVPLRKGQFKEQNNNPKRSDGTVFLYCPPEHVEAEMDKLVSILSHLEQQKIKPVIIAAWLHHAFTQIHPFQDGNGRLARLLASLILIRYGLFPFTVQRNERKTYINALEQTDKGDPKELVAYFCAVEKRNIEGVLNRQLETTSVKKSLEDMMEVFSSKVKTRQQNIQEEYLKNIEQKRIQLFEYCDEAIQEIENNLKKRTKGYVDISTEKANPQSERHFWFLHQVIDYANRHGYFVNKVLPRGWFKITFDVVSKKTSNVSEKKQYDLVVSVHHYGYDSSTIAVGAFLRFIASPHNARDTEKQNDNPISIPLNVKPHIISLEADITQLKPNLKSFIQDVVTVALGQIVSEL